MTAPAPSGVVTFSFTDIEGSTRRWDAKRRPLLLRRFPFRTKLNAS